jgi:hypothetical protein
MRRGIQVAVAPTAPAGGTGRGDAWRAHQSGVRGRMRERRVALHPPPPFHCQTDPHLAQVLDDDGGLRTAGRLGPQCLGALRLHVLVLGAVQARQVRIRRGAVQKRHGHAGGVTWEGRGGGGCVTRANKVRGPHRTHTPKHVHTRRKRWHVYTHAGNAHTRTTCATHAQGSIHGATAGFAPGVVTAVWLCVTRGGEEERCAPPFPTPRCTSLDFLHRRDRHSRGDRGIPAFSPTPGRTMDR